MVALLTPSLGQRTSCKMRDTFTLPECGRNQQVVSTFPTRLSPPHRRVNKTGKWPVAGFSDADEQKSQSPIDNDIEQEEA